jgi:hypothetical protein
MRPNDFCVDVDVDERPSGGGRRLALQQSHNIGKRIGRHDRPSRFKVVVTSGVGWAAAAPPIRSTCRAARTKPNNRTMGYTHNCRLVQYSTMALAGRSSRIHQSFVPKRRPIRPRASPLCAVQDDEESSLSLVLSLSLVVVVVDDVDMDVVAFMAMVAIVVSSTLVVVVVVVVGTKEPSGWDWAIKTNAHHPTDDDGPRS